MKILHLNLSNGAAGDMLAAALVSAGVSPRRIEKSLAPLSRLGVPAPHIRFRRVEKKGLPALAAEVPGDFSFKNPSHIASVIKKHPAAPPVKKIALAALDFLVSAEARAHKIPRAKVHFHELNSKDTLIDILGTAIALDCLSPDKITATPLNTGRSNPATLDIVKSASIPVYSDEPRYELATPTGAAIIAALRPDFEPLGAVEVLSFGGGAGSSVIPGRDNILRIIVGQTETHAPRFARRGSAASSPVVLMETNIDDMNPELYPSIQDALLRSGSPDVWLENIIMKHGRPAVKLCCLVFPEAVEKTASLILENTTSSGVRWTRYSRISLPRSSTSSSKVFKLPSGRLRLKPENRF